MCLCVVEGNEILKITRAKGEEQKEGMMGGKSGWGMRKKERC